MLKIPREIIKPARYTGIEPNAVMKDPAGVKVRFALCFPDVYDVGMSYYGHFLLYEIANRVDGVWCERCYAPWDDMELYLRKERTALYTLESKTPLGEMDLVGFSLTYELNVTNVLNMLDLSGIPVRAEDRTKGPIVIGGGPLTLNPAPFERFFDLIVMGEADQALIQILERLKALKGSRREDVIRELADIPGVYSPLLGRKKVERQVVMDLDGTWHAVRPPIPVVGSIHNRLNVEVSRGCGNGCRFCLAGFGYRPYRERSYDRVVAIIDEAMKGTGYEEISLLSLSTGDYSALFKVISYVKEHYKGISVSLPSLKMGTITEADIRLIGDVARTGLTFALESSTAELRCRLNKNIDVEMLIGQLPVLRKYGWRRLKLYLMVGFPWETDEDIWSIRDVVKAFEKGDMEINLSVSPFTPKPHTPFQWLPMEDEKGLADKMLLVKSALKGRRVRVRYRDVKVSVIEALIARGDERLNDLIEYVFSRGGRLEAWREHFQPHLYSEWFTSKGINMEGYLRGRSMDQPLPWDFVDTGVEPSFLARELQRAEEGVSTVDCLSDCAVCGIGCKAEQVQGTRSEEQGEVENGGPTDVNPLPPVAEPRAPSPEPSSKKYTFRYGKYGDARYLGHLDTMNIMLRALRSVGAPIKTHGKYHPLPKVSLSEALPVGVESTAEFIEIETQGAWMATKETIEELNRKLPRGMRVYEVMERTLKSLDTEIVFLLVAGERVDDEGLTPLSNRNDFLYAWKGKGVKALWGRGVFKRIIKLEEKRIHGIRTRY